MTRRGLVKLSALALALTTGGASASGQTSVYFHMPSTLAQYLGVGYGAGHQAPIVRTYGPRPPLPPRSVRMPGYCAPCGWSELGDGDCCHSAPMAGAFSTPIPTAPMSPTAAPMQSGPPQSSLASPAQVDRAAMPFQFARPAEPVLWPRIAALPRTGAPPAAMFVSP